MNELLIIIELYFIFSFASPFISFNINKKTLELIKIFHKSLQFILLAIKNTITYHSKTPLHEEYGNISLGNMSKVDTDNVEEHPRIH